MVRACGYEWINPDDFLLTPSGRLWTPERSKYAWEQAYTSLKRALDVAPNHGRDLYLVCGIQGAGKSTWIRSNASQLAPCVFFDAALPRAIHRAPTIKIARASGVAVHAVWVDTPVEEALRRNSRRPDDERVPEASIRSVAVQFEPPTVLEGFEDVLHIQTDGASKRASS